MFPHGQVEAGFVEKPHLQCQQLLRHRKSDVAVLRCLDLLSMQ